MTLYTMVEGRMCQDCGHDTRQMGELYMVHPDLWSQVLQDTGWANMLCVGCLESRLGRRLCRDDFPEFIPLNYYSPFRQSLRLRQRLQSSPGYVVSDT